MIKSEIEIENMNWGTGVAIAFVLFASFIMYMVVSAFQQDFDLVSDEYYLEEINYQNRINDIANLNSLEKKVAIHQNVNKSISIEFPVDHVTAIGEIHFYHVAQDLFDRRFPITLDNKANQVISREGLVPGRYRIKMSWTLGEKGFFQETELFVK